MAEFNRVINEKDLASKIVEMSAIVEEITPLLKEIPELKEKDVNSLREAIIQLYTKSMIKPALNSYRDVLSGTDSYEAQML